MSDVCNMVDLTPDAWTIMAEHLITIHNVFIAMKNSKCFVKLTAYYFSSIRLDFPTAQGVFL